MVNLKSEKFPSKLSSFKFTSFFGACFFGLDFFGLDCDILLVGVDCTTGSADSLLDLWRRVYKKYFFEFSKTLTERADVSGVILAAVDNEPFLLSIRLSFDSFSSF